MYLQNYKNEQGVIIFSAVSEEVFGTLTIDGNHQRIELPKNRWKEVKVANEVEIIQYSDSEGNVWDLSYGTEFPYSYNTLDKEVLNVLVNIFKSEAEEIEKVLEGIKPLLGGLKQTNAGESIISHIRGKGHEFQKMAAEYDSMMNPRKYDGEDEICESEPQSDYGHHPQSDYGHQLKAVSHSGNSMIKSLR